VAGEESKNVRRIPEGPRGVLLDRLLGDGATLPGIWRELQAREGISGSKDFFQEILRRYGNDEAAGTVRQMYEREAQLEKLRKNTSLGEVFRAEAGPPGEDRELRSLLMVIPDGLFLSAVAAGFAKVSDAWGEYEKAPPWPFEYFNEVFEKRNVPYRFDQEGEAHWHGDEAAHEEVIEPAISCLGDERLSTARKDFAHAQDELRLGTAKARKEAANYATKTLEGTLKAVIEDQGLQMPDKTQAFLLWKALKDGGVVEEHSQVWVTATTKVSNEKGRHSNSNEVTVAEAEAALMSAAVAVIFFSSFLT
jgi:hypothetical protein